MSERVAVIVAHPDDEVLMCGGTIAAHVARGDTVNILIVADGVTSREGWQREDFAARWLAASEASDILGASGELLGLPDQKLDTLPQLDITRKIEAALAKWTPSIVYTHWHGDTNKDHRVVSECVMVACRPKPDATVTSILMGEVQSSTEYAGGFRPTVFSDITRHWIKKADALGRYASEVSSDERHPRSIDAVRALARWRGASVGRDLVEAFELVRMIA